MNFMNDWDIERAVRLFNDVDSPNLFQGACTLLRLSEWADRNSDGWCYWPKPVRAAASLIDLLERKSRDYRDDGNVSRAGESDVVWFTDATDAELSKALRPIKAFLTRQGVEHHEVIE